MPPDCYNSQWAYDDAELKCPKSGSEKIHRVLEQWCRIRGIRTFSCASCGNHFYGRGHDSYQLTFEN